MNPFNCSNMTDQMLDLESVLCANQQRVEGLEWKRLFCAAGTLRQTRNTPDVKFVETDSQRHNSKSLASLLGAYLHFFMTQPVGKSEGRSERLMTTKPALSPAAREFISTGFPWSFGLQTGERLNCQGRSKPSHVTPFSLWQRLPRNQILSCHFSIWNHTTHHKQFLKPIIFQIHAMQSNLSVPSHLLPNAYI